MSFSDEHDGLHELFYLDGVCAATQKSIELLDAVLTEQVNILNERIDEEGSNGYAGDDRNTVNQALEQLGTAIIIMRSVRATISERIG